MKNLFINALYKVVFFILVINVIVIQLPAQAVEEKKTDNKINKCNSSLASDYKFDPKESNHITALKFKANLIIQTALEQASDSLRK